MVAGGPGDEPRDQEWQRGGAAGPRSVLESHPQNQDPAGAGGEGRVPQPLRAALCDSDQILSTGTTSGADLMSPAAERLLLGFFEVVLAVLERIIVG